MGGGRYRTRTSDLVRVKQRRCWTGLEWSRIPERFWTSEDLDGPLQSENRLQTASKTDLVLSTFSDVFGGPSLLSARRVQRRDGARVGSGANEAASFSRHLRR